MKQCTQCLLTLPLSEFGYLKASKDGRSYQCKHCIKTYNKKRNPDKLWTYGTAAPETWSGGSFLGFVAGRKSKDNNPLSVVPYPASLPCFASPRQELCVILSGQSIRRLGILDPCADRTHQHGLSFGLGPAGYDLRLVLGNQAGPMIKEVLQDMTGRFTVLEPGEFTLAAAQEHFSMPSNVLGIVHDKSSLARLGLSVFNTVIEPGWNGHLTLELINGGPQAIRLVEGQAIAQVVFHLLDEATEQPYDGKYQNQSYGPQVAHG